MFTQCIVTSCETRSATCICNLCMSSEFLPHPCLLKVIFVSPDNCSLILHVYIRVRTNTEIAFEVYDSQSANLPPTEAQSTS